LSRRGTEVIERGREGSEYGSRSFFTTEVFGTNLGEIMIGEGDVEETDQEPEGLA
jgi:hypothetical protein